MSNDGLTGDNGRRGGYGRGKGSGLFSFGRSASRSVPPTMGGQVGRVFEHLRTLGTREPDASDTAATVFSEVEGVGEQNSAQGASEVTDAVVDCG